MSENKGDLISREALKRALNYIYDCAYIDSKSKEGIASDIIAEIDSAPTVKTYCYFCGQKENGKEVNDTVKIEVTEHHTFAKPDDVSDIKFGDE